MRQREYQQEPRRNAQEATTVREQRTALPLVISDEKEYEVNTMNPLFQMGLFIGGLLIVLFLIIGLFVAHAAVFAGAAIFVQILVWLAIILVPLAALGAVIWLIMKARMQARMEAVRIRQQEARAARMEAEAHVTMREIRIDERGNAGFFDVSTHQIVQLRGNMQEHPELHSLHYSYKNDQKGIEGQAVPALPAPALKPTIEEIVSAIKQNSYEFVLGRSLQTGELIKVELPDAHIKLIGGSRMGKSCEAAAILDQACKTHDTKHLHIALLDLEYKTSRLFEHDPHVLTLKMQYKSIKMHAKSVAEVAECLIALHELMLYRYELTDAELLEAPHVLIYLEEFLYWKKLLSQFVSSQVREKALEAFAGIATRGLKVGLHLMACAQVDYSDEELRDAMAQFLAVNVAFSVKPDAARAAGFINSELLKKNFAARTPGLFVVEAIGGSDMGIAPDFDVRAKLQALTTVDADSHPHAGYKTRVSEVQNPPISGASETPDEIQTKYRRNTGRNEHSSALQAKVEQVMQNPGENMAETIKRVWGATPGDNTKYKQAKQEYIQVQEIIHSMAKKAMESYQLSEMEEE